MAEEKRMCPKCKQETRMLTKVIAGNRLKYCQVCRHTVSMVRVNQPVEK